MIEYTGRIQVHHPDREDRQTIARIHADQINRLQQDQNNPDGAA